MKPALVPFDGRISRSGPFGRYPKTLRKFAPLLLEENPKHCKLKFG
jgi:hypothetical protein